MATLWMLLVLVTNFASGHSIDWKQERSLRTGKLKHSLTIIVINGVTFIAIVSWAGFGILTAWAALISLLFLIPLCQIPYNGRYNFSFANGWRRYRSLKHWTYAVGLLAWYFF